MPPSNSRFPARVVLFALALCALLPACSSGGGGGGDGGGGDRLPPEVELLAAFGGLAFSRPVKLVQHPSDATRWYVVEQGGKIRTFLSTNPAGTLTTALDLVADFDVDLGDTDGEQGLLGMAFDPGFATTGAIYLSYTDEEADDSILARYASLDDGLTIVPSANPILLAIPHPNDNHNAGDLAFGNDGFLYYGTGDGGGGDDPDDNGQDRNVLLGKVLRLDVRSAPPMGRRYAIPPTNPFSPNAFCDTGSGTQPCPEIFAWGFRNPWRMNFDPTTNDLWLGDVGQGAREEIDRVQGGRNYGWDCFEGDLPHATAASCGGVAFEDPVAVHDRTEARAITGGAVYRGSVVPDLRGFYVYADFVTGRFFAFDVGDSAPEPAMLSLPAQNVSAFGQDRNGEVYVVTFGTPSIYTLVPATP
jgi:glucose/arabinose dehydrogenase